MMLYDVLSLSDKPPSGYIAGLKLPNESFSKLIKASAGYKEKGHLIWNRNDLRGHSVAIQLRLECVIPASENYREYNYCVGTVTITSMEHNCSTILISNLTSSVNRIGIASFILEQVLNWAKLAGYTNVICSIAGAHQHMTALPLFKKFNFEQMGPAYVNSRTLNTNTWLQKILVSKEEIERLQEEERIRIAEEESYYEEDEEDF